MIVFLTIRKRCLFHCFSVSSVVLGILKTDRIMLAERKMKYALIMKRYPAPRSMSHRALAIENPQVHSGGISAVAIATPGITVFALSILVCPMIPASPPKKAISTSKKVGDVLASNSTVGSLIGESQKKIDAAATLIAICIAKPSMLFLS